MRKTVRAAAAIAALSLLPLAVPGNVHADANDLPTSVKHTDPRNDVLKTGARIGEKRTMPLDIVFAAGRLTPAEDQIVFTLKVTDLRAKTLAVKVKPGEEHKTQINADLYFDTGHRLLFVFGHRNDPTMSLDAPGEKGIDFWECDDHPQDGDSPALTQAVDVDADTVTFKFLTECVPGNAKSVQIAAFTTIKKKNARLFDDFADWPSGDLDPQLSDPFRAVAATDDGAAE